MQSPLTWVLIVIAALVVLKVFSIVWAVLTLHGFRVERARTSLNVTHGLLTRASTVIPLHRIQQDQAAREAAAQAVQPRRSGARYRGRDG